MSRLRISLFGKMRVDADGQPIASGLDARKVQELLSYLVLNRQRPVSRENLADLLWGDNAGTQARKYLRQALWQLQSTLKSVLPDSADALLQADSDWVAIGESADLWTDVGQFESAYRQVQGTQGQWVSDVAARDAAEAVDLYSSGLLEGWYHDWCIFERERLENVYLSMLSKLIGYYESRRDYETGILYGHRILRQERAHERTHWTMMRLYYLAGDRTSALRQYERCASALKEELGVTPAKWTMALREQIMNDSLSMDAVPEGMRPQQGNTQHPEAGDEAFFQRLQGMLTEFRYEIRRYIGPSGSVSGE